MEWKSNMLLVRFDTEKQLQGILTSFFCAPSHSAWIAARPTLSSLNTLLFSFLTPLLYLHKCVQFTAPPRITKTASAVKPRYTKRLTNSYSFQLFFFFFSPELPHKHFPDSSFSLFLFLPLFSLGITSKIR